MFWIMFTSFVHKHLVMPGLDRQIMYTTCLAEILEYLQSILLEFHTLASIPIRTATVTASIGQPPNNNSLTWHDVIEHMRGM